MKLKITFLFVLVVSLSGFSQVEGPPPPCGRFILSVCDGDEDGFGVFNLVEGLPFQSLCAPEGEVESNYSLIKYYETELDMINEINPIVNPTEYVNTSNPQDIFCRANAINVNAGFSSLTAIDNYIELTTGLLGMNLKITMYDNDSDGLSVFDLSSLDLFCVSNNESGYNISYHLSQLDAESYINKISTPSNFENTSNNQIVYARIENLNSGDFETTPIVLSVIFAVANQVDDIYACDSFNFDFTTLNSTVLRNQNPNNFTVTYHSSQVDAENKTNIFPNIYDVLEDVIIYCRVEENSRGSYAVTSFNLYISKTSSIAPFESYEVCDDDGDNKAIFDLASIRNKIVQDANYNYFDISFHLDESASGESFIPNQDSYVNITNPQTIYVDIEDWGGNFDCFKIFPIELKVLDCSTKGVIEINAFYDEDENSTLDNNEINFLNGTLTYEKNNDGVQHSLYSSNGVFNIISDDDTNTYDISYDVNKEYDSCYNLSTTSYESISVTNGSQVNYNFPITKVQDCGDIALYITPYASPRPGFDYYNRLIIENKGLETVTSGFVEFTNDSAVTFNNVSGLDTGNTVTNTATGFRLDFVNLQPNQREYVDVIMNVPVSTSLGTVLTNTVAYSVTDLNVENNVSTLSETVIGSYDPNDINESHGPEIFYDDFTTDDYLYYTIRFQNVGTADAINVSIDNTLDAKLNQSTIQMLSASHDYVFTRTNNQLNWKFDNIHLPSEDMDEPASHGYVYYKIKPLAGYAVGDIIPNTAEIYFDFNEAVITNMFETEFVETLSSKNISNSEFSISPNPSNGLVALSFGKINNSKVAIDIYNIQGKHILNTSKTLQNKSLILDVSNLKNGFYFIKARDGVSETTKKLIIN